MGARIGIGVMARNRAGAGVAAPSVTTSAATNLAATTATLGGTVNPNGIATTYYFEYGLTTSYGTSTTPASAGSGSSNVPVTANIVGLDPSTTYHFRLVAIGAVTVNGSDATFTTGPFVPVSTAHWTLNENGGPYVDDVGSNAHPLTAVNTPGTEAGLLGNAAVFDHTAGSYAHCATDVGLKVFTNGGTIVAWVKPKDLSVNGEIWSNWNGNAGAYFGQIGDGSGGIRLTLNNFSSGYYAGGSGILVLDTYACYVVIYDPTQTGMNRLKLLKNGIDAGAPSDAGTPPATLATGTNDWQVGTGPHGSITAAIQHVWAFPVVLTAVQVTAVLNEFRPLGYPGTAFDNHVTIILDDFTGVNGTLLTDHVPTPTNTLSLAWVEQGSGGKLGHLNGSGDLVCDVGGICTLDTGSTDNTVTVYGRIGNGEQIYQAIAVLIRVVDFDHYLWFHIKYDGTVLLLKRLSSTPGDYAPVAEMVTISGAWPPNDYTDHHWTIKDIGGYIRLYKDGVLIAHGFVSTYAGSTLVGLGENLQGSPSSGAVIKKLEVRTGDQLPTYPYPGFSI